MLEVHIPSVGPEAGAPRQSPEKGHMVFRVEVQYRGRRHAVPRRYSEFHALHKRIKKLYKVPEFPSKRLPNWRARGLELRRRGLEAYIQGVLYLNPDVPKELLEFLNLRHFPTDPKASSWGALGEFLPNDSSLQLHHQPVIGFRRDPYTCISSPAWRYQTNVNCRAQASFQVMHWHLLPWQGLRERQARGQGHPTPPLPLPLVSLPPQSLCPMLW